ncbi:ferredoxin reductase [Amycolatopsis suaedae]|uniref:Ferredoxin reductase n=1 Tax=Amycolatopsis suaedae TaxID=2510978 RepID=A0A4Q7JCU2_9PSEU|nr:ferredoxin reductase [Amycolatopsis suaedae]RZQ64866.1 ferredoxin reductase [Amycolatopsis suaedae]
MGRLTALAEALLTPHGVDRYLELLDPMLVRREIRGVVTGVRHQTPRSVTLTVRPSKAWPGFTCGQYTRVTVDIDAVRHSRCYSLSGSQHRAGELELHISTVPDGLVSRYLREHARPGMVLGLSRPQGEFTLPPQRPERILLIAGGSGITPVLSMLRTLADERYGGEVTLLYYTARPADQPYRDELAELAGRPGVRVVVVHTRDHSGSGPRGHFRAAHLSEVAPWYREAPAYVCGPVPLLEAVRKLYDRHGLGEQLHTEQFTPAAGFAAGSGDTTGRVRFTRSGREAGNTGSSLLEQAEAAGLTPEYGCRMGICFSCTARKSTGRVRDLRSGAESAQDDEEIQLCVSAPVGDVAIEV